MTRIFTIFTLLFLIAAPALAQIAQGETERTADFPAAQGHVVTSTSDCLQKLDPSDAADIRINYAYPYQECLKRLAGQKAERQKAAAEKAATESIPETPRNYVRVKKPAAATEETPPAAEPAVTDEITESGAWSSKKYAKEKVNN